MSVLIQQGSHFSSQPDIQSFSKNDELIASYLAGLNNTGCTSSAKQNMYSQSTSLGYNHSITLAQRRKSAGGVIDKMLSNVF